MKIARNVAVFGRHDEWYSPIPAPSLRELLSAAKLRECTTMNGKNQNLLSFVGAMKIARNLAVSGRHIEWYSSFPAPSLREPGGALHSSGYSLNREGTGDFHRPYESSKSFTFHHATCRSEIVGGRATFVAPKALNVSHFTANGTAPSGGEGAVGGVIRFGWLGFRRGGWCRGFGRWLR